MLKLFPDTSGFRWDKEHRDLQLPRLRISPGEAEQVFYNLPVVLLDNEWPSQGVRRHALFGKTDGGRLLAIIFSIKGVSAHIIAAREMSRREKAYYESRREIHESRR